MAIKVPIISTFDPKGFKSAETTLDKFGKVADAVLLGFAAAGTLAAKAAIDDAKSAETLAQTMRNVAGATEEAIAKNEDFISKLTLSTGVADDQLRPALDRLVRSTGKVSDAQNLLKVAMDVSAGTGKDLQSVTEALAKANEGSFTSLKRLGIPIDENTIKTKDFDKVLSTLSSTFSGQMDVAANSTAGKFQRLQTNLAETQEEIGTALLPIIEKFLPKIEKMADWVSQNTDLVEKLATALGIGAIAIKTIQGATVVWNTVQALMAANAARAAAGQWALNAAVLANPFVLITVAVIALVAAIVYLWNTNEEFREKVTEIWNKIKAVFVGVFNWIKENWPLLLAILTGPFGLAALAIAKNWDKIVEFFKELPGKIKNFFTKLPEKFKEIGGNIVDGLWNGLKSGWNWLTDKVSGLVDGLVGGVKSALEINSPSKVFTEIGKNVSQGMANGIESSAYKVNVAADALTAAPNVSGGAGAGQIINLTVNGAIDAEGTARTIQNVLRQSAARTGNYTNLGIAPLGLGAV